MLFPSLGYNNRRLRVCYNLVFQSIMLALLYQPEKMIHVFGHLECIWLYHVTEIFFNIFICSEIFLFEFIFTENVD